MPGEMNMNKKQLSMSFQCRGRDTEVRQKEYGEESGF